MNGEDLDLGELFLESLTCRCQIIFVDVGNGQPRNAVAGKCCSGMLANSCSFYMRPLAYSPIIVREWRSYVPLAAPVMKADPFSRGRIATVTDLVKALQGPGSECFVVSFGSRQTD